MNDALPRATIAVGHGEKPQTRRAMLCAPRSCRRCGCTEDRACWDKRLKTPCAWAEQELCSACLTPREFDRWVLSLNLEMDRSAA